MEQKMASKCYHHLHVADDMIDDMDESSDDEDQQEEERSEAGASSHSSNFHLLTHISAVLNNIGVLYHEMNELERGMACHRESMQIQIKAESIARGRGTQMDDDEQLTRRLQEVRQREASLKERQGHPSSTTRNSPLVPAVQETASMVGMNRVAAPILVEEEQEDIGRSRAALSATTMFNISLIHQDMGNTEALISLLNLAIDTMPESLCPDLAASLHNNLGYVFYQEGRYPEAVDNLQDALEYAKDAYTQGEMSSRPPTRPMLRFIVAVMINLARAQDACEFHEDALLICSEAEALLHTESNLDAAAAGGGSTFDVSALIYVEACIHHRIGDRAEAHRLYHRFMHESRAAFGQNHPRVAAALQGTGVLYLESGNQQDAMHPLLTALDVRRRLFGEASLEVAESLHALGRTLQDRGEFGDALETYKRSWSIQQMLLGHDHPSSIRTACYVAQVHQVRGELGDALAVCQELLRRNSDRSGPNRQFASFVLRITGTIFRDMGQVHEANAAFLEAFEIHQDANQLVTEVRCPKNIIWLRKENHDAAAA